MVVIVICKKKCESPCEHFFTERLRKDMHALGGRSDVAEVFFAAAQGSNGIDPMTSTSGMET